MSYDAGLVERLRDALVRLGERGTREKNVFGGRGFLLGKRCFVIAWGPGVLVKTTPNDYATALGVAGVTPFAPGGERPMGTWVVVPDDVVADDPELAEWVSRGLAGVRAGEVAAAGATKKNRAGKARPTAKARLTVAKTRAGKGAGKTTGRAKRAVPPARTASKGRPAGGGTTRGTR